LKCEHCGAVLVADQRYCLSCGQPASPTRMSFLDAMQTQELAPRGMTTTTAVVAAAPVEDTAGPRWLKRYAPLFAVASVLLLALLVGLLLGHWVTQSGKNQPQVVKLEGLGGLAAAQVAGSSGASSAPSEEKAASSGSESNSGSGEKVSKGEESEAKAEEAKHAAPPKAVKVSKTQLDKLEKSTGKKHQEELNKIGTSPIAVP
jgi:hypothetical protein